MLEFWDCVDQMSGSPRATFALLPDRIFVGNRRWVAGRALVVRDGRILSIVEPKRVAAKINILELPGVALLPGFVNAHTHLEYTDPGFIKPRKPHFVDWLDAISAWKQSRGEDAVATSHARGVRECLAHGTIAIGDHYHGASIPWPILSSPLKGVVFHELISLADRAVGIKLAVMKRLSRRFPEERMRFGIAPHAPYSVNKRLLSKLMAWAGKKSIPVSMHVAESEDEDALSRLGECDLGRWIQKKSGEYPPVAGQDLFGYLQGCRVFSKKMLAVHMNLARGMDLKHLPPSRVRPVTCPRSHEYFGHAPFALEMFLNNGYCVAMGTDSLASNDSLDMFAELRAAKKIHPRVPLERLWDMATVNGAQALGLSRCGMINTGNAADFCAIPASRTRHALEQALDHRGEVTFSMIQGKVAWPPGASLDISLEFAS